MEHVCVYVCTALNAGQRCKVTGFGFCGIAFSARLWLLIPDNTPGSLARSLARPLGGDCLVVASR